MDHGLDIIPISSYRHPSRAGVRQHLAIVEERGSGRWQLALVAVGMLVIVGRLAWPQIEAMRSIRGLPPAERTALYQRTLSDTQNACTLPGADTGALEEYCLRQVEFLILFPECDGPCQKLARAILPHARR